MTPRAAHGEALASLHEQLAAAVPEDRLTWLDEATRRAREAPGELLLVFPGVGRRVGRGPLEPGGDPGDVHAWTIEDAARTLLLAAAGPGADIRTLYRGGDAAERRGVLRSFGALPEIDEAAARELVDDAVRTNDPRLIAAALGPWAMVHLTDAELAQAVLKCVFVGIPLGGLVGVEDRVTPALSRMLAAFAHERVAAGRDISSDVWPLIAVHPPRPELELIEGELDHPTTERADAARRALDDLAAAAATQTTTE